MIVSFRHKGLEQFFKTGSKSGIDARFAPRLEVVLSSLDAATNPQQLSNPGWGLHPLHGKFEGHWAVKINKNWRLTFRFIGENAEVIDLQDYH